MPRTKGISKKLYIAIALLVVVCVVTAAIVYAATQPSPPKPAVTGVSVGDTFTYSIKGFSTMYDTNVASPNGIIRYDFNQYNQTEYYKVTVTSINGTQVSLDIVWKFINGTEIPYKQTIDLSNGKKTDDKGFWLIYASNLNVNQMVRPSGFDGVYINSTDTRQYKDSVRQVNYFSIENEFMDYTDPTRSTYMDDIRDVNFDTQTGMVVSFINYQQYNKPAMALTITWTLTDSSVWAVQ